MKDKQVEETITDILGFSFLFAKTALSGPVKQLWHLLDGIKKNYHCHYLPTTAPLYMFKLTNSIN